MAGPSPALSQAAEAELASALDFINTLEHSREGDIEHLPDAPALLAWLAEHGFLGPSDAASQAVSGRSGRGEVRSARWLTEARALRAALRRLVDALVAGSTPRAHDVAHVDRWLRRRPGLALVDRDGELALRSADDGDPVRGGLARLAEAAARGLVETDRERLRLCANDECRWAFYDTSRGGRRRWCDMASCGNRAKVRRHRERRAATGPEPPRAPRSGRSARSDPA